MRCFFSVVPLLASGCVEPRAPADPEDVLVGFAETMAEDVYSALWSHVDSEVVELWHPEDGASFDGSVTLPTASGERYGVDGELVLDWGLLFELAHEMEGIYRWTWDVQVELDRLAVAPCELAGTGSWSVEQETYDYSWTSQRFEGQLRYDDRELEQVSYEAHHSGNLHWVRGHIGAVEVDWENPNPDLP